MLKIKRNIMIGGFAIVATIGSIVSTAGPMYFEERIYYSDNTFTEDVGEETITCRGSRYLTGQRTPYWINLAKQQC